MLHSPSMELDAETNSIATKNMFYGVMFSTCLRQQTMKARMTESGLRKCKRHITCSITNNYNCYFRAPTWNCLRISTAVHQCSQSSWSLAVSEMLCALYTEGVPTEHEQCSTWFDVLTSHPVTQLVRTCKSHEEAWRVIMSPHLQEDRRVRRGIRHNCQHCKTAWHMHDIRITTCRSSHLRGGHHSHRAFSPPDSNGLYKSFSKLVSHDTAHWKDMINALNELMVHSVCMGLSLHSSSADDKSARFLSSAAFCKAFSTTDMALSYRAGSKACRI